VLQQTLDMTKLPSQMAGARLESEAHLKSCSFEALRQSIYATSTQISGIQDLLVAQVWHPVEAGLMAWVSVQFSRTVLHVSSSHVSDSAGGQE